jgi:hypothetical protein
MRAGASWSASPRQRYACHTESACGRDSREHVAPLPAMSPDGGNSAARQEQTAEGKSGGDAQHTTTTVCPSQPVRHARNC